MSDALADNPRPDRTPTPTPAAPRALADNAANPWPTIGDCPPAPVAEILPPAPVDRGPTGGVDPDDIEGAFAPNTRRAYAAPWRIWTGWCRERGKIPVPALPGDVAEHLKERAAAGAALATLRLALAAIATAHRIRDIAFDRLDPQLTFPMRRLARELGEAPTKARQALTTEQVVSLLPRGDNLLAIRDRAIILVDYAGGFRRSEVVAIDLPDIEWKRDGILVRVRRSKTDQGGAGQVVGILYGKKERTCPVRALKAWLAAASITAGPVFRAVVGKSASAERLDARAVHRAVKRLAEAAGIDPTMLGSHSLRAGHVTQVLDNGGDAAMAKQQLRHARLDTTLRYDRGAGSLRDGNTSGKLGL